MSADTQETWRNVECPSCGKRVSAGELAEHLDECRKREHPTEDRFE